MLTMVPALKTPPHTAQRSSSFAATTQDYSKVRAIVGAMCISISLYFAPPTKISFIFSKCL